MKPDYSIAMWLSIWVGNVIPHIFSYNLIVICGPKFKMRKLTINFGQLSSPIELVLIIFHDFIIYEFY